MTGKIKPALTAGEWAAETARQKRQSLGDRLRWATSTAFIGANPVSGGHGLAALALYDQPFGFTREDVAELRWLATIYEREAPQVATIAEFERTTFKGTFVHPAAERNALAIDRIRNLADRIEALLPPADV